MIDLGLPWYSWQMFTFYFCNVLIAHLPKEDYQSVIETFPKKIFCNYGMKVQGLSL